MNRFDKANQFYQKIIQAGENAYTPLARLEIGEILYKQKKYTLARHAYEAVIKKYPESEAELKAVYRLGGLYAMSRDMVRAKAAYNYIIQSYPMSIEASFAKKKMEELAGGQIPIEETAQSTESRQMSQTEIEEREIAARESMGNSSNSESRQEPVLTEPQNSVKFTLHIGNFRSKGYADNLYRKLVKRGFKAYIVKKKLRGITYFLLRVGSYNSRQEAEKKAKVIISRLHLRVSIVDRT